MENGTNRQHGQSHHEDRPGEVEQREFGRAPVALHRCADEIVEGQADDHPEDGGVAGGKQPGDQPPQLALENEVRVKIQHVGGGAAGEQIQNEYGAHDEDHIAHQVRDSKAGMVQTEAVNGVTELPQNQNLQLAEFKN